VHGSRRRSKSSARANAHAAGFYVALAHDGYVELANEFASWWLETTGESLSREGLRRPLPDLPGSEGEAYSLDELGIDQEDFEWP
jgi:hypothetical protein